MESKVGADPVDDADLDRQLADIVAFKLRTEVTFDQPGVRRVWKEYERGSELSASENTTDGTIVGAALTHCRFFQRGGRCLVRYKQRPDVIYVVDVTRQETYSAKAHRSDRDA